MEKSDMIKYAAMAVAAYLLWQWLTKPGGFLALPGATTGDGTGAGATGGDAGAGTEKVVSTPPTTATATPTDKQIYAAALSANNAGQTGGWRQSAYAWNWYREQAARELGWTEAEIAAKTQGDLSTALDMNQSFTAAEYHAALAKVSLEGLGMAQGWGGGPRYSYQ